VKPRESSTHPLLNKWVLRGLSLALLLAAWEVLAYYRGGLLLPRFSETVVAWIDVVKSGELLQALAVSNQAVFLGFAASVLVGVPLGLIMGRITVIERFTDPYLNLLLVVPMSAIMPLILIALGLGLLTRTVIVFSFGFVIIATNTRAGMRSIDPALVEMARSFGANELQLWRRVFLPGSFPAITAGVRMGLGRCITGMVVVELLLIAVGLGRMILAHAGNFDADYVFAVVITILIEAVVLMNLAQNLEKWLLPWRSGLAGEG
jgi:NitT/TauT family transport system permease protein